MSISLKYRKIIQQTEIFHRIVIFRIIVLQLIVYIYTYTRTTTTSRIPVYTYHDYVSYTRIHVPLLRLVYPYTRTTISCAYTRTAYTFRTSVYTCLICIFITLYTHIPYFSFFFMSFIFCFP